MKYKSSKAFTSEIVPRLRTLMVVRVLLVSILLGAGLFAQVSETETYFGPVRTIHFVLLASVYTLTIVYALLYKLTRRHFILAYVQLGFDAVFTALIMTVTGGMHSVFSLLFVLIIIAASTLLYRSGGVILATFCALLYSLVVVFQYWPIFESLRLIAPVPRPAQAASVLYLGFVNILAFYVVAFLTSYLAELAQSSRSALQAKQEDLQQLESLTDGIIKSISSGVIALDHRGLVVLFNPAAESIFHISASQVIGKPLDETIPFLAEPANLQGKTVVGSFGCHSNFRDLCFFDNSGKKVRLRCSISPLRLSPKGAFGLIMVIQDITEIKEIEDKMAQVQTLSLVGELAAGIAHEIRNPMASISGSMEMLKEELTGNQLHARLIDIVLKEINRLHELTTDFLAFARPRKPSPQDFDLHKMIAETLELFKHSPHWVSKITIHSDLSTILPIRSDPQLTKQILWNLLRNACEAMPSGGDLYVTTATSDNCDCSSAVTLEVRDTGPGLSEESRGEIFKPFFTTKHNGSGLGLATVKRIVEVLGGNIVGENHPDGGACFKVTIPSST